MTEQATTNKGWQDRVIEQWAQQDPRVGAARAEAEAAHQAALSRQHRKDREFMDDAKHVARKSKDRSTKCGCVIVNDRLRDLVRGWNGFPSGVNDDVEERHERPAKYLWTEHAERNAIYNAAAEGVALRGCTAYVTLMPCCDCARALIQAGIRRVVTIEPDWEDPRSTNTFHWGVAMALLQEAGVQVDFIAETEPG